MIKIIKQVCRKLRQARRNRKEQRRQEKVSPHPGAEILALLDGVDFDAVTYYPQEPRKTPECIKSELVELWVTDKGAWTAATTVEHYFKAGYDRAACKMADHVMQKEADLRRNARYVGVESMLNNKEVTYRYFSGQGIPISGILGRTNQEDVMYDLDGQPLQPFAEWLLAYGKPVFVKPIDGYQGRGACRVRVVSKPEGIEYCLNEQPVSRSSFEEATCNKIVETLIVQSENMNTLFAGAVNTVRIITVSDAQGVRFATAHLMIGAGKSACSNRAQGGVVLGVDENGVINSDGVMKTPPVRTHHPDTGIKFKGYKVQGYKECIDLAIRAHRLLSCVYSIGWDVAITENGPIIVEANEGWGVAALTFVEALDRKIFDSIFTEP